MYKFFPRRYPDPGTGNYAFDAQMTLPLYQVQGAGMIPRRQLGPRLFNTQMLMNNAVTVPTDYTSGGWVNGQLISQPLSPPASS